MRALGLTIVVAGVLCATAAVPALSCSYIPRTLGQDVLPTSGVYAAEVIASERANGKYKWTVAVEESLRGAYKGVREFRLETSMCLEIPPKVGTKVIVFDYGDYAQWRSVDPDTLFLLRRMGDTAELIRSKDEIPRDVLAALVKLCEPCAFAGPREAWNPTDVYFEDNGLPERRLVTVWRSGSDWVIEYMHGGRGNHFHTVVLNTAGHTVVTPGCRPEYGRHCW